MGEGFICSLLSYKYAVMLSSKLFFCKSITHYVLNLL